MQRSLSSHYDYDYERELVEEIAAARWRLRRTWIVETGLFDFQMDKQSPELDKTWDNFDEVTRLACLRRNCKRAVANLEAWRKNKKMPNEPTPDPM